MPTVLQKIPYSLLKFPLFLSYWIIGSCLLFYTVFEPEYEAYSSDNSFFIICALRDGKPVPLVLNEYKDQALCKQPMQFSPNEISQFKLTKLRQDWQLYSMSDGLGDPYYFHYRISDNDGKSIVIPIAQKNGGVIAVMSAIFFGLFIAAISHDLISNFVRKAIVSKN